VLSIRPSAIQILAADPAKGPAKSELIHARTTAADAATEVRPLLLGNGECPHF
jgi:hypothetical protein